MKALSVLRPTGAPVRPGSAPWALHRLALRLPAAPNTPSTDAIIPNLTAFPTGNQPRKKSPVARQAFNSNSLTNLVRDIGIPLIDRLPGKKFVCEVGQKYRSSVLGLYILGIEYKNVFV